jgi:hypothetical protein
MLTVGIANTCEPQPARFEILWRVAKQRLRRQTVAARASRLLIVGLHRGRQIDVTDEAHIGFIDAHAERDRCHHDNALFGDKLILMSVTCAAVESGVIGKRIETGLAQLPRQAIGLLARRAIEDAGLTGMFGKESLNLT